MADLIELYQFAEQEGIDVDWISMGRTLSLSVPLTDGTCCIALDPWKMDTVAKETVCLAHELGHCKYGAFYDQRAALDIRQKHENKADKWAIKMLIPEEELQALIAEGRTEIWELAEYFNVTEDFMCKALCWYKNGNLDVIHT